ncbi:MAG: hypothetical protein GEU90_14210 [Gemmatimonas sp.]|nr:hypothetical protein [Gemmatimonas sp.]
MADMSIEHDGIERGQGDPINRGQRGWGRLSWGAVFAGFFVAVGAHLVLGLIGVAIGLSAWSPGGAGPGVGDVATGIGIWAAVSALIALFLGGATTGHLAGYLRPWDGFLHGAILWSLVTVATLWLVINGMGFLLGGALGIVGRTASATVDVASTAATEVVGPAIGAASGRVAQGIQAIDLSDPRQRSLLVGAIAARSGVSTDSVEAVVSAAETRAGEARQRVAVGADSLQQRAEAIDLSDPQTRQIVVAEIGQGVGLISAEVETIMTSEQVASVQERVGAGVDTVQQRAYGVAEDVSKTTSHGVWWTLLALGLSLGAAGAGASATAKH